MRLDLEVLGSAISLEIESPSLGVAAARAWRPALIDAAGSAEFLYEIGQDESLRLNGEPFLGHPDIVGALPRLEWDFLSRAIQRHERSLVLHAGAVVFAGWLVLLVGESGAGKSTFTRLLLQRGASYLSDDMVAFDGGEVRGVRRTVQFDPLPVSEAVPPWLVDCDLTSYAVNSGAKAARVPLWTTDHAVSKSHQSSPGRTVVVRLERAATPSFGRLDALARVAALHGAALKTARAYDGRLDPGPAFGLTWREPEEDARALLAFLGAG